ncbi:MAG: class II fructose-bisphosphate aldolase [Dermabacter sp.]|nr:class II fructose-bisphosphate aldolase [Dermabacter sp.]
MPLAPLSTLAQLAQRQQIGLGAFNVVQIETAETLVRAAESSGLPIVLQISQNAVAFHGGALAPLGKATLAIADAASVPVVVHLDHADDLGLIRDAIALGFSSVMFDGSRLDYRTNVRTTALVVTMCHAEGLSVEAELGEVGGKDGVHAPGARTSPDEARAFVDETGVDLLAVAVGSSHAMTERSAQLDTRLISALSESLAVPLVLHGSSGVSDAGMVDAIAAGMTKINVSTHLNALFTKTLADMLHSRPGVVDPRAYIAPANRAVQSEVERLLHLYASTGHEAAALSAV